VTREQILKMIEECTEWAWYEDHETFDKERFAALVAAAEREECAKLCEKDLYRGDEFAERIRARGETK
jgi:hypothetical protein